jgi:hypothetical protein
MFIHFGSPDNRGHKYGWMSDSYLKALRQGDEALGLLLSALDQYGLLVYQAFGLPVLNIHGDKICK